MAEEIGIVSTVIGNVTVIDINGISRTLQAGDKIFQNDLVSTDLNGAVEISLEDGNIVDIARNSQLLLDENIYSGEGSPSTTDDVELIQQTLLDGEDPTASGEATAAGDGVADSDSGSSFVFLARSDDEVIPTSGFETTGIDANFPELLEEQEFDLLDSGPENIPTISTTLSSSTSAEFTVTNYDRGGYLDAGFRNSYGYYIKSTDSSGNIVPIKGIVLENDVHNIAGETTGLLSPNSPSTLVANTITVPGYTQDQIGYFLIPNGGALNSKLVDGAEVDFSFVNGQWWASLEDGSFLRGQNTSLIFDDTSLNVDSNFDKYGNGIDHIRNTVGTDGNQNWEDLPFATSNNNFARYSDNDFNDVNINVDWTSVTASGDALDSVDLSGDTLASIDFTLESISKSGLLTSYGKEITFTAKDTDGDGFNDQIIGSTDDRDVLTLDGILDGDYSLSVLDAIDDNQGDSEVDLVINVSATDTDGDVGTAVLNVNLNIDANQLLSSVVSP
jgi:hypothetical protein